MVPQPTPCPASLRTSRLARALAALVLATIAWPGSAPAQAPAQAPAAPGGGRDGGVGGALAAADGGGAPLVGGSADAGPRTDLGFSPTAPSTWRLAAKLPPGSKARRALVADLCAPARPGIGEAALTSAEAEALLDDPRAQLVYGERTVQIVAPSMLTKQRKDHLDLMALFLKPERIDAGATFARTHEASLAQAERTFGVDREVIVAILMWETKLGTITGDYVAFNAFVSQAFFIDDASAIAMARPGERALASPERQARRVESIRARARANLLALVRQCKAKGIDPLSLRGSWAGALGFPQFMPASLRWAADGDGDGHIDLFGFPDAIASIGRYLKSHGYAASRSRAVWGYNHEEAYVEGVLAFAAALERALGRASDGGTRFTYVPSPPANGATLDGGAAPALGADAGRSGSAPAR